MICFSGNDGSLAGMEQMRDLRMGLLITAAGWRTPPRDVPWILDNGAFTSFRRGEAFDARPFLKALDKVPLDNRPRFGILPDIVAGGLASLRFSERWLRAVPHGWPWYLAVQDGMEESDVEPLAHEVAGIFVGGSLEWKHATAEQWVGWAHARGLPVHIGRVGTVEDLVWARRIGADSVDSTSWAQNGTYHYVSAARSQMTLREAVTANGQQEASPAPRRGRQGDQG